MRHHIADPVVHREHWREPEDDQLRLECGVCGVWGADEDAAYAVAERIASGTVWVNEVQHLTPFAAFGGMKQSGIGRDGGDYSFDFYMETKHVSLARGTHKIQKLGVV